MNNLEGIIIPEGCVCFPADVPPFSSAPKDTDPSFSGGEESSCSLIAVKSLH